MRGWGGAVPWTSTGAQASTELDVEHAFPEWIDRAMFVGFLTVAVLTATADVERRWLFIALLVVAVVPSAIELVRPVSSGVFAAMVLVPLAILNWAPASVGLQDPAGTSQANLLIATFLVGQTVATAPRRVAIWVVAACFALPIGRLVVDDSYQALPIWVGAVVIGVTIGVVHAQARRVDGGPQGGGGRAGREGRHRRAPADRPRGPRRHRALADRDDAPRHGGSPRGRDAATTRPPPKRSWRPSGSAGRASTRSGRRSDCCAPSPTAASRRPSRAPCDIVQLVDGFAAAGVDVRLALDGDSPTSSAPAGLTAFRVVQESLANAVRHQPGSSTVVAVDADDELHVRVTLRGRAAPRANGCGPGNGLAGDARAGGGTRGTFAAGPAGRSAWLVECRLPEAST